MTASSLRLEPDTGTDMRRPLRANHRHPWARRFGPCGRPAGSGTGLPAPLRHRRLHLTLTDDQRTEEVEEPRHLKARSPHGQAPDDLVTSTAIATLPNRACRRRLYPPASRPDPRTPSTSPRGEDLHTQANTSGSGIPSTSHHGEGLRSQANTSKEPSPDRCSSPSTPGDPGRPAR
jgi:hypothetical protein